MNITILKGDGIGPEVMDQGIKVLEKISELYAFPLNFNYGFIGGDSIDRFGVPLTDDTIEMCRKSDSVLLGAVGGEKWNQLPKEIRPEAGLLKIRKELNLFANLRPAILFNQLKDASPLKNSLLEDGLDIMIVRELTGGIYFGEQFHDVIDGVETAWDTMKYMDYEIERIARVAFEIAQKRNKKLTLVDKANVLENSRLWRKIVEKVSNDYKNVELNYLYVDNASMQLVCNPKQFDVIVTGNMFGDIISDEASVITGSIGMLPSASLSDDKFGLYEPIHGSAPDIAGQNIANPLATIMSVAMMLKYSFDMNEAFDRINAAVEKVLENGYRTKDIYEEGKTLLSTTEMGEKVIQYL
ncbi:3-isopropylmalate dehydrogenase [Clostridium grantii]|uniref:3-isopropylmalate dehydrogenase n=1 Tax=Clostridium grantii DSM 8605 TaxID=1121316 RepID=A0A1M5RPC2_9CLOT|nr:3-isopropylmalate dehydrogenase [Clostridium grantii]SHH27693.1 3-isopropylmalate dehydrogenase [Clostridium grantii DSM 8605]